MHKFGDESEQPNDHLCHVVWPTSQWHFWCRDAHAWWPQLPSPGWYTPTSSQRYDRHYWGGIIWWHWDAPPKCRMLPDDQNGLPKIRKVASKEDYVKVAKPWSHFNPDCFSLWELRAKPCCWWGCGLAKWAQSHCESCHRGHFGQ